MDASPGVKITNTGTMTLRTVSYVIILVEHASCQQPNVHPVGLGCSMLKECVQVFVPMGHNITLLLTIVLSV